jgi:UDP-glucuronate decarboxylase
MRILVAGGAGFLGSHLCKRLLDDGHEVICVDNLSTGSIDNINFFRNSYKFEFIRHDVTFPLYLEVDGIFNLACPASPQHYQNDPVQTMKSNVHGAINLLGLAKRTKARILQTSTSEVYGDPEISPQAESYWGRVNPNGIRSCYDEGKRAAESLFMDYHRQYKLDTRIARIFNTYGPGMARNDGRVVSNFIMQALENKPISIFGEGSQTRSFCYVDDLIDGLLRLFWKQDCHEPINLGNPEEITIKQLASEIIQLTGSKSEIVHQKLPEDDPKKRNPDISLAQSLLGWHPKVTRNMGLSETISDFRKRFLLA